jgi:hypothetical protein
LARFANRAKGSGHQSHANRAPIATLVAFVHCLEATAQDEVLEVAD